MLFVKPPHYPQACAVRTHIRHPPASRGLHFSLALVESSQKLAIEPCGRIIPSLLPWCGSLVFFCPILNPKTLLAWKRGTYAKRIKFQHNSETPHKQNEIPSKRTAQHPAKEHHHCRWHLNPTQCTSLDAEIPRVTTTIWSGGVSLNPKLESMIIPMP